MIDQLYLESKHSTYCAMVVEMHSTGHTTKEISEQLEISENQVAEIFAGRKCVKNQSCRRVPMKRCKIEYYIPVGAENAVTRKELCRVVGVGDRTLRSMIADARRRVCICNSQDGAGYYLPSSVNQAKAFYAQERKRADSIIKARVEHLSLLKTASQSREKK